MEFTQEEIYHIRMALKFYANRYNEHLRREVFILDDFPNNMGLSENDINVVKGLRSRFNVLAKAITNENSKDIPGIPQD